MLSAKTTWDKLGEEKQQTNTEHEGAVNTDQKYSLCTEIVSAVGDLVLTVGLFQFQYHYWKFCQEKKIRVKVSASMHHQILQKHNLSLLL